ncbi:hypothetical protein [Phycicoccus sp. HDW14]|nr:hypothetical protein [Phycicoccus sp. HDW14]
MPLTRVYLPLTADDLEALATGRELGPAPSRRTASHRRSVGPA